MKTNKVVVFDLDDTLYNEIDFLKSAYQEISDRISKSVQVEYSIIFNDLINFYFFKKNAFKEILKKYSTPYSINDLLCLYRNHKPNLILQNDKLEVLRYLKDNNIPICLLTDGRSVQQRNKLKALGVLDFFSEVIISEEFGSEKPHINNYKYFEGIFGRAQYYYIGDNLKKDFITPNKLGWITICLKDNGLNIHSQNINFENRFNYADYTISNFHQINSII
jgi:putative hydrolase of the HAD superfamily